MKRSGSATACSCMGREETLGWGHDRLEKKQRSAAHRAPADAARGGGTWSVGSGLTTPFGQWTRGGSYGSLRRVPRYARHAFQVEEGGWQVGQGTKRGRSRRVGPTTRDFLGFNLNPSFSA
jgi:hypothetical protein